MADARAQRRARVLYRGHVQGVGFRYTVAQTASQFPRLGGFVMNLQDGSVLVEVEGSQKRIAEFLEAIDESRVGSFVHSKNVAWGEPTGRDDGFRIRYATLE